MFTRQSRVHRVSAALAAHHAAFAEPLSCALHAVERARLTFGDVVVVAGCGPIGLGMIAGAVAKSAGRVVALDRYPARLDLARKTGATDVIDVTSVDPIETVKAMTGGYGADVYFEATGHPSAVGQGLQCCASSAATSSTACSAPRPASTGRSSATTRSSTSSGPTSGRTAGPRRSSIEHDALPLDGICSHQLPLARFEEAFELVASADRSVKVTLLP